MIIFLFGPDTFRSTRKLHQIQEKFYHDVDPTGTNTHIFNAKNKDVSFENIYDAMRSLGFFSSKRLIIIKNIFSQKMLTKDMTKYLNTNPTLDDVILLFWESDHLDKRSGLFKRLRAEKYSQEFSLLKGNALTAWITQELKIRGARMEKELIILLAQAFGEDMWRLSNELDKLIAFANGQKITKNMVADFNYNLINTNIFDFIDCISTKNEQRLAELFQNIIEAENEMYILSMMQRQFRLLSQTKKLKKTLTCPQELARETKIHPFVAKKLWQQVDNMSLGEIQRGIDHLVRAELDIKTGRATAALALQRALFG